MKKNAFTLAELLVALSIIGTISAIAIPVLIFGQGVNNAKYVNGLKKNYTNIMVATENIMSNNGGTVIQAFLNSDDIATEYCNHLKCSKICGSGAAVTGGCFHSQADITELDGTPFTVNPATASYRSFILSDGSYVLTNFVSANCATTEDNIAACGWFYVDVNGNTEPNVVGRDIFKFIIHDGGTRPNTGLYISGSNVADTNTGTCSTASTGLGCASELLRTGKMEY
jgi:prepilin-type N-terminal cleavage/methylation domain-containing protein